MTTCSTIKHCCQKTCASLFNEKNLDKAIRIIEKISVVALGVLAAMTAPELFMPAFALGALIGLCTEKQTPHRHHHHSIEGGCSHGFIEERLGVKLPDSFSLLAGTAVLAVHIDHHADVFVPITGFTLGFWAGNQVPSLNSCKRAIKAFC